MNTELLRRILDKARDDAANPSAAMEIEDLAGDCFALADLCEVHTLAPDEIGETIAALNALCAHVGTQPFDVVHDDPEQGVSTVTDVVKSAFELWLGELERLAQ